MERVRAYGFVAVCAAFASAYAVVHDQITCTISWEYFAFGKDIGQPTSAVAFRLAVCAVAVKGTWWVGAIAGLLLLGANHPRWPAPVLGARHLAIAMMLMLAMSVAGSVFGGLLGYLGVVQAVSERAREFATGDSWRPRPFLTVWGAHAGGYLGAAIGLLASLGRVVSRRRLVRRSQDTLRRES